MTSLNSVAWMGFNDLDDRVLVLPKREAFERNYSMRRADDEKTQ